MMTLLLLRFLSLLLLLWCYTRFVDGSNIVFQSNDIYPDLVINPTIIVTSLSDTDVIINICGNANQPSMFCIASSTHNITVSDLVMGNSTQLVIASYIAVCDTLSRPSFNINIQNITWGDNSSLRVRGLLCDTVLTVQGAQPKGANASFSFILDTAALIWTHVLSYGISIGAVAIVGPTFTMKNSSFIVNNCSVSGNAPQLDRFSAAIGGGTTRGVALLIIASQWSMTAVSLFTIRNCNVEGNMLWNVSNAIGSSITVADNSHLLFLENSSLTAGLMGAAAFIDFDYAFAWSVMIKDGSSVAVVGSTTFLCNSMIKWTAVGSTLGTIAISNYSVIQSKDCRMNTPSAPVVGIDFDFSVSTSVNVVISDGSELSWVNGSINISGVFQNALRVYCPASRGFAVSLSTSSKIVVRASAVVFVHAAGGASQLLLSGQNAQSFQLTVSGGAFFGCTSPLGVLTSVMISIDSDCVRLDLQSVSFSVVNVTGEGSLLGLQNSAIQFITPSSSAVIVDISSSQNTAINADKLGSIGVVSSIIVGGTYGVLIKSSMSVSSLLIVSRGGTIGLLQRTICSLVTISAVRIDFGASNYSSVWLSSGSSICIDSRGVTLIGTATPMEFYGVQARFSSIFLDEGSMIGFVNATVSSHPDGLKFDFSNGYASTILVTKESFIGLDNESVLRATNLGRGIYIVAVGGFNFTVSVKGQSGIGVKRGSKIDVTYGIMMSLGTSTGCSVTVADYSWIGSQSFGSMQSAFYAISVEFSGAVASSLVLKNNSVFGTTNGSTVIGPYGIFLNNVRYLLVTTGSSLGFFNTTAAVSVFGILIYLYAQSPAVHIEHNSFVGFSDQSTIRNCSGFMLLGMDRVVSGYVRIADNSSVGVRDFHGGLNGSVVYLTSGTIVSLSVTMASSCVIEIVDQSHFGVTSSSHIILGGANGMGILLNFQYSNFSALIINNGSALSIRDGSVITATAHGIYYTTAHSLNMAMTVSNHSFVGVQRNCTVAVDQFHVVYISTDVSLSPSVTITSNSFMGVSDNCSIRCANTVIVLSMYGVVGGSVNIAGASSVAIRNVSSIVEDVAVASFGIILSAGASNASSITLSKDSFIGVLDCTMAVFSNFGVYITLNGIDVTVLINDNSTVSIRNSSVVSSIGIYIDYSYGANSTFAITNHSFVGIDGGARLVATTVVLTTMALANNVSWIIADSSGFGVREKSIVTNFSNGVVVYLSESVVACTVVIDNNSTVGISEGSVLNSSQNNGNYGISISMYQMPIGSSLVVRNRSGIVVSASTVVAMYAIVIDASYSNRTAISLSGSSIIGVTQGATAIVPRAGVLAIFSFSSNSSLNITSHSVFGASCFSTILSNGAASINVLLSMQASDSPTDFTLFLSDFSVFGAITNVTLSAVTSNIALSLFHNRRVRILVEHSSLMGAAVNCNLTSSIGDGFAIDSRESLFVVMHVSQNSTVGFTQNVTVSVASVALHLLLSGSSGGEIAVSGNSSIGIRSTCTVARAPGGGIVVDLKSSTLFSINVYASSSICVEESSIFSAYPSSILIELTNTSLVVVSLRTDAHILISNAIVSGGGIRIVADKSSSTAISVADASSIHVEGPRTRLMSGDSDGGGAGSLIVVSVMLSTNATLSVVENSLLGVQTASGIIVDKAVHIDFTSSVVTTQALLTVDGAGSLVGVFSSSLQFTNAILLVTFRNVTVNAFFVYATSVANLGSIRVQDSNVTQIATVAVSQQQQPYGVMCFTFLDSSRAILSVVRGGLIGVVSSGRRSMFITTLNSCVLNIVFTNSSDTGLFMTSNSYLGVFGTFNVVTSTSVLCIDASNSVKHVITLNNATVTIRGITAEKSIIMLSMSSLPNSTTNTSARGGGVLHVSAVNATNPYAVFLNTSSMTVSNVAITMMNTTSATQVFNPPQVFVLLVNLRYVTVNALVISIQHSSMLSVFMCVVDGAFSGVLRMAIDGNTTVNLWMLNGAGIEVYSSNVSVPLGNSMKSMCLLNIDVFNGARLQNSMILLRDIILRSGNKSNISTCTTPAPLLSSSAISVFLQRMSFNASVIMLNVNVTFSCVLFNAMTLPGQEDANASPLGFTLLSVKTPNMSLPIADPTSSFQLLQNSITIADSFGITSSTLRLFDAINLLLSNHSLLLIRNSISTSFRVVHPRLLYLSNSSIASDGASVACNLYDGLGIERFFDAQSGVDVSRNLSISNDECRILSQSVSLSDTHATPSQSFSSCSSPMTPIQIISPGDLSSPPTITTTAGLEVVIAFPAGMREEVFQPCISFPFSYDARFTLKSIIKITDSQATVSPPTMKDVFSCVETGQTQCQSTLNICGITLPHTLGGKAVLRISLSFQCAAEVTTTTVTVVLQGPVAPPLIGVVHDLSRASMIAGLVSMNLPTSTVASRTMSLQRMVACQSGGADDGEDGGILGLSIGNGDDAVQKARGSVAGNLVFVIAAAGCCLAVACVLRLIFPDKIMSIQASLNIIHGASFVALAAIVIQPSTTSSSIFLLSSPSASGRTAGDIATGVVFLVLVGCGICFAAVWFSLRHWKASSLRLVARRLLVDGSTSAEGTSRSATLLIKSWFTTVVRGTHFWEGDAVFKGRYLLLIQDVAVEWYFALDVSLGFVVGIATALVHFGLCVTASVIVLVAYIIQLIVLLWMRPLISLFSYGYTLACCLLSIGIAACVLVLASPSFESTNNTVLSAVVIMMALQSGISLLKSLMDGILGVFGVVRVWHRLMRPSSAHHHNAEGLIIHSSLSKEENDAAEHLPLVDLFDVDLSSDEEVAMLSVAASSSSTREKSLLAEDRLLGDDNFAAVANLLSADREGTSLLLPHSDVADSDLNCAYQWLKTET